jgi:AcrR family transcriptional regulator
MKDDTRRKGDLPRSLEALWKRADRRRGAAKQALSLERIVAAAIEVADAEGLAGLSMARVAEKLGCATMSLYRHVPSKDDLQVFMMDAAPGEPPDLALADGDWRAGLERWAHALRAVYLRHPWVLQITGTSPPLEPGQLAWLDRGLAALRSTRLRPAEKLSVIMFLLYYVRGEAQLAAGRARGGPPDAASDREVLARYGGMLAQLIDPERFPALGEAIAAGVFDPARDDTGASQHFEFGLARVLDGIAALEGAAPASGQRRRRTSVAP